MTRAIEHWQETIHSLNQRKGFYDYEKDIEIVEDALLDPNRISQSYPRTIEAITRLLADYKKSMLERKLLLTIGELCEAHEELRNGHDPREIYFNEGAHSDKPEGVGIETADAHIRLFDLEKHAGIDTEYAMILKHDYNGTREYKHGKTF